MSHEGSGGEFLVGLIIGAFIGAAVALILAPQSGDETIAQIKDKSIELKERAADLSGGAMRRMEEMEQKSRSIIEEQKSRLQEAVQEGKEAAAKKKEELLGELGEGQAA